jgi:hypothetical protein
MALGLIALCTNQWTTPKWLERVQIAWNLAVAVGMLAIFPLASLGRARPWMAVALVAGGSAHLGWPPDERRARLEARSIPSSLEHRFEI